MMQYEYDENEMRHLRCKRKNIISQSRNDKRAAHQDLLEWMQTPEHLATQVLWMITGSYGYAEAYEAQKIANNPRMNRAAALFYLFAELGLHCPHYYATKAWKALDAPQQEQLTAYINQAIIDSQEE